MLALVTDIERDDVDPKAVSHKTKRSFGGFCDNP